MSTTNPIPGTLAARLCEAMALRGLTTRQLSDKSGLTYDHILKIQKGLRRHLDATTCLDLAKELGCTVEWLVDGKGPGPT